ncbi:nitrilase [Paenibacillus sp. 32O-W]|uniref:carbon-nitrogen family hydrolase n=1 Tax=Paenibacillus sp. 32O-W TaxID=1695218 RepID=UPI0007213FEB|nr:carbon-nitrogen family hydrolase [Paenibacillus sp. 32O-W]ALS27825.1 nitrilase [Paenibacillus sp. 32O-W]
MANDKERRLKIALLQMDVRAGEPEANFAKLVAMLEEAAALPDKPDIVVAPEMWNTGYALERIGELADPEGSRTKSILSAFARKHGIHLIGGSIAEKRERGVYNTAYSFDRQGRLNAAYSKIHLFRLMDEEKHLLAGDAPGRLAVDGEAAGMMICYDIRFPELARKLALDGAKVLFVPAEWPHPRLHHWRTLLMARAIENQMFVIACNRCGTSGDTSFFGHSMVIDPWGEIVAEAGEEETVLTADIDLALVDEVRARIPVFEDRRPSLYAD